MRIRVVRLGLAVGFLALAALAPSSAQVPFLPSVRVKAGVFLPQNTSLRNAVGNTWLKVGADVSVPLSIVPLGSSRVGIEYAVNGSSNLVPITFMQVFQPSAGVKSPVYLGAGVGLWTGHIHGFGTNTRIGFRLMGGVDFTKKLFLELQYDFVDRMGPVRADGFSALVGTRF